MVEWIVIFSLGALSATLIALMAAPVLGRRTARLVEARVRAQAPLSLAEIQSQKDQIRAEFAVRLRKLEVRLDEVKATAVERQIALGRREDEVRELRIENSARRQTIAELEATVDDLRNEVLGLERHVSEQGAALKEKQRTISTAGDEAKARMGELNDTALLADSRKVEIVALKTQVENLEDRIEDMRAELAAKAVSAEERAARIDELGYELKGRDKIITALEARVAQRREVAARRREQVAGLRDSLAEERVERAARTTRLAALEAAMDKNRKEAERLEQERDKLRQRISDLETSLDLRTRELTRLRDQPARARADKPTAAPTLDAMAPAAGKAPEPKDAARLRESINDLAAQITRLAAVKGDDQVRKLIDGISADGGANGRSAGDGPERGGIRHATLAERIKEADLQPGE